MGESSMTTEDNNLKPDITRKRVTLKELMRTWGLWALGGAALLATTVVASLITVRLTTPVVVTFDMKGTMDLFMQQSVQLKLDEASTKALTQRFSSALKQSLVDWQKDHHAIILVAPAVVSQQTDITATIRSDINRRMQEAK
ncbi:type-F conjugative transfer system protein TrbI [Pseudescherichia sp.]|uniref:type-F conjugative transfer system protein TrbI n=1 Tax=Pseudescherichia sp. TaxID=2055881 RepID=UPI0028A8AECC|nr:type-F conjugative transfer system protein TrbI [Pseudescherichia sp.]